MLKSFFFSRISKKADVIKSRDSSVLDRSIHFEETKDHEKESLDFLRSKNFEDHDRLVTSM